MRLNVKGLDKKILVFTHGIDIDGYGCAILAKLAWGERADIVYADTLEIDDKFLKIWNENGFEDYSQIFVTDHCPSLELCEVIDQIPDLKNKICVLDHHFSRIGQQDKFDWVSIISEKNGVKESGTSLFYKYLINRLLLSPTLNLDEMVNLTRLYDTWEWTKINEVKADRLNNYALAVGREEYVNNLLSSFKNNKQVWFGEEENKIVDDYLIAFNKKVAEYVEKIKVIDFADAKAGYVNILDIYKNDIATAVRNSELKDKIDFMLMPVDDRDTVSLRSIRPDFDVSAVAAQFGGGGHKGASSFPKINLPKIHFNKIEF